VTKSAVPGRGRGSGGKSSRGRRWYSRSKKAESVKGSRAVIAEERTPRSRILHSKARGVELRIVSCKLADGKNVMNHLRSNENIGKMKGTRSRTYGGDRKTRTITNHDRRMQGANIRKNASIRGRVERSPRVSNTLGANRRCHPHVVECLHWSGWIPSPRPGRRLAGLSGWSPGWRKRSHTSEHGGWLVGGREPQGTPAA
jgi:hypothetical protein